MVKPMPASMPPPASVPQPNSTGRAASPERTASQAKPTTPMGLPSTKPATTASATGSPPSTPREKGTPPFASVLILKFRTKAMSPEARPMEAVARLLLAAALL